MKIQSYFFGKHGGSVVECQTPEREIGVRNFLRRVVSLRKTLYSLKVHIPVIYKFQLHRQEFGHGRVTIHHD